MHISCIFSGLGAEARANVPRRESMVNQGFLLPHIEVVTASNVAKHQSHLQKDKEVLSVEMARTGCAGSFEAVQSSFAKL